MTEDENGNPIDQLAEVIIAKNRNGATGKVSLRFDASKTNFSDFPAVASAFFGGQDVPF